VPWWAKLLISLGTALLVGWLITIIVLLRIRRGTARITEATRLLPDLLRLLGRLARDRSLPRGARIRLWLLLCYLASPIDVVPDFIPLAGYADDVIVVIIALRSVVKAAGPDPLARHWPGTAEGLDVVRRLAGL
jgi:uncharacterized membrane protein YkvA (DUF1232 family)